MSSANPFEREWPTDTGNNGSSIKLSDLIKNDEQSELSTEQTALSASPEPTTPTTTTTTTQRPTTPIPNRKFSNKQQKQRSMNFNLKINTKIPPPTQHQDQQQQLPVEDAASGLMFDNATNDKLIKTKIIDSASSSASTTNTTIFPHEQYRKLKKLDIGFKNIKYSVKTGFFKRENKDILNKLNGNFHSGELTAIIGPSGAGKSTLLNIISAYTAFGYSGDVLVNGSLRVIKTFKPNIAYIRQDTSLQPFLTVKEAMHFAANLKIGSHMTKNERKERGKEILKAMGLYDNRNTFTGNLSGGQKKRLAIALELVSNPPALMLDEPTSGLDSSTSNQVIALLKKLAMEGRTVICTIHQPSALTFNMFDHLYAIANGECIYSGGTQNLLPFLKELDLNCPESYNPADYLMEIATGDYGPQNGLLVAKIENGLNDDYRQTSNAKNLQLEAMRKINKMMSSGLMTPVTAPILSSPPIFDAGLQKKSNFNGSSYQHTQTLAPINEMSSRIWESQGMGLDEAKQSNGDPVNITIQSQSPVAQNYDNANKSKKSKRIPMDPAKLCKRDIYATPFYRQLSILLLRTFLILWRDKSLTTMRFVIHFLVGLMIGFLYYGIGNDAANALNNFRYAFYTIMFIMYCAFSAILVKFPLEFPIVSREHFNRWYSLRAYYVAITLADIPIQMISTSLFILTTYIMTDQPMEIFRLALFSFIVFLTALVAQSIGLAVGASLDVTLGSILGPFFICPFLAFSGFFLQHKDAPSYLSWIFHTSFLKYSLDGSMLALFGYNRPKLECTEMYCHYSRPQIFLKDLDMGNADYLKATIFLFGAFLGLRVLSFYIMSFRLRLFR